MDARRSRTALGVAVVAMAGALILILLSFIGNKASQTVSDPTGRQFDEQPIAQLFRQGWGFFTRDAREDIVRVAHADHHGWRVADGNVTSTRENLFGLSRRSRNFDQDLSFLLEGVPAGTRWTDCRTVTEPESCLTETQLRNAPELSLHSSSSSLCGTVVLTRQPPVPFAFSRFRAAPPGAVLALDVKCFA
ncbi:SdpA family antimicrobial peptide system protein [Curtobacterium sp. SL109]|uniref:SdpA family antimicrobial peptide system protein n=1 Tax=Curtobacterium sp. SL109 TaxID=2994662 RepID=UPI0022751205|nr:SdpA family antimicrobial peptide system protein [Curtobacterium sp. SL109]MCY1694023.1 SdpA family antimicrobial peptide system protein [Curtobacterium sp. SL109]